MNIGVHAAHELYSPADLLSYFRDASAAGIRYGMCSDHFHPWSERQAASGFAWSWLPATLQATQMTLGTVCAPGQRYHPAIIAQAVATICDLFPERLWLALGSGEFLNESITGDPWPHKVERNHRLMRSAEIMRALWRGERVSHAGAVQVREAKLYTLPKTPPLIFGAALTVETAGWVGSWADGLITCGNETDALKEAIDAFRQNAGAGKPVKLQIAVSYGPTFGEALAAVHRRWRHCGLSRNQLALLPTPWSFDAASADLSLSDLQGNCFCTDSVSQLDELLGQLTELGIDTVYFNDLSDDRGPFMEFLKSRPADLGERPTAEARFP